MTIEIAGAIFSLIVVAIGFGLAYKKEDARRRRFALTLGFLFGVVGTVCVIETIFQRKSIEDLSSRLDRDWVVLRETPVNAIQFEVMAADGLIAPDLLYYVQNIHLEIPGAKLGPALEQIGKGGMGFSQIFTEKNLKEGGQIGTTVADVRVDEKETAKTIKAFNRVDCTASQFITSTEISNYGVEHAIKRACSVTVTVPLPAGISAGCKIDQ